MGKEIIRILNKGGVGVLLTDTLYGLVGSAHNKKTVERIYKIKGRNFKKPLIILIASIEDLKKFSVKINSKIKSKLKRFWPGPVSIILPCDKIELKYLHRGTKTLAFRLPKNKKLINILRETGPLVAPSANTQGQPPAQNIQQAKKYFASSVDFYKNEGEPRNKASRIIKISRGLIRIIRK